MQGERRLLPFPRYVGSLLERGEVNATMIAKLTTGQNLEEFRRAFTHKSANPKINYDYYEIFGDTTVNEFVAYYIPERLPEITSVRWITRIKHTLVSAKVLGAMAIDIGMDKYMLTGQEFEVLKRQATSTPEASKKLWKIMSDLVEAFCGCLVMRIQLMGHPRGAGIEVAHRFLRSFFSQIQIPTEFEEVFDAVSRLKETYEARYLGLNWPKKEKNIYDRNFMQAYGITRLPEPDKRYHIEVYGWPLGDRRPVPKNQVLLSSFYGFDKDETKQFAADVALKILRRDYGIALTPPGKKD